MVMRNEALCNVIPIITRVLGDLIPKFLGHVQEGRVKGLDTHNYLAHLQKLENKDVYVTVQNVRQIRTDQQMKYYWGVVIAIIARDTGNEDDPEEVHEALKEMFAPKKMIKLGQTETVISGCTHDLFKDYFFENYIRKIQAWYAQEFSGVIPDPKEVEI